MRVEATELELLVCHLRSLPAAVTSSQDQHCLIVYV